MNKYEVFAFISLIVVLVIAIFLNPFSVGDQSDEEPIKENNNNKKDKEVYWGVDSASYTNEDLYQCVTENFGQPKVWGRYLESIEGVSEGLNSDEVNYLHEKEVRILVIYNHFNDATSYDRGVDEAEQAISYAKDLDIPEGIAIFGDIEPSYPVDSAFIEGWYDTLTDSAYEPAIYGVFDEESTLLDAYNATNQDTKENTVVWTAYPQEKITTKENAPKFNPKGPSESSLYGWQYAIDAEECNIDTNLFSAKMLDYLW